MKLTAIVFSCVLLIGCKAFAQEAAFEGEKISFSSLDGLEITADFYPVEDKNAPFIILFHQANFSRGEYRPIAPKLNELGYNCLAVDQRSGHKALGVINETCKRAIAADKKIKFKNALQDMEAALLHVKNEMKASKVIIWGSSYSASLVLYMGATHQNDIDGILSFSPGEYFKIEDQEIASYTDKITCPVFITSAKKEKSDWKPMYDNIKSDKSFYLPEDKGFHGSKALWPEKEGHAGYWNAVKGFLGKIG